MSAHRSATHSGSASTSLVLSARCLGSSSNLNTEPSPDTIKEWSPGSVFFSSVASIPSPPVTFHPQTHMSAPAQPQRWHS
eukprot:261751-Rhodomonas_salina.1